MNKSITLQGQKPSNEDPWAVARITATGPAHSRPPLRSSGVSASAPSKLLAFITWRVRVMSLLNTSWTASVLCLKLSFLWSLCVPFLLDQHHREWVRNVLDRERRYSGIQRSPETTREWTRRFASIGIMWKGPVHPQLKKIHSKPRTAENSIWRCLVSHRVNGKLVASVILSQKGRFFFNNSQKGVILW